MSALDARTPVLVGIGVVDQRLDDPTAGRGPLELMRAATRAAGEDAGAPGLLPETDSVWVPRGFWEYADPGRALAEHIGAKRARSALGEIGVLQQTLLSEACRAIASGQQRVAIVAGGEARHRAQQARRAEIELAEEAQSTQPDLHRAPHEPVLSELEMQRGLFVPVRAYAVIENALRFAEGRTLEAHGDELARLWSQLAEVAATNPHAWMRDAPSRDEIRAPSGRNRMLAFPYTRLHTSDWNVDQAAALLLCSVETARAHGIPRERWVFPLAATESNHVVPLPQRRELHRSPGAAIAGARVLELAGMGPGELTHLELYSCFPAAVRVFQRELGLDPKRTPTVTGGMAFAGGPLNNYVLQSTARLAERLREEPGASGLVSCVSGFLNKQGFAVWSSAEPAGEFAFADLSAEVAEASPALPVTADGVGAARVVGYTVCYEGDAPSEAIAVCELPDGSRSVASTSDGALIAEISAAEFCGREVALRDGGRFDI